jgi:autotransporter-associated beta strand protein
MNNNLNHYGSKASLIILALAIFALTAARADFVWVGPGDPGATNNWDNAGNWNWEGNVGVLVPGQATDQTHVNDGGFALIDAPLSVSLINELDLGVNADAGYSVTNSVLADDFETYTDGAYTTTFGPWTVTSGSVLIANAPAAYAGTNSVSLGAGVISITLPTQSGIHYLLQYACQGAGITISGGIADTFNTAITTDWEVHSVYFLASTTGTTIQVQGVDTATLFDGFVLSRVDIFHVGTVLQTAGTLDVNSWFNLGANGSGNGNGTYDISGGVLLHTGGGNFQVGNSGSGTNALLIHGTGIVTNATGGCFVGSGGNTGTNTLVVADNGIFVHTPTSDFNIGDSASGCISTVTITNSGIFSSKANFFGLGHSSNSKGTLNVFGGSFTHAGGSQLSLGQGGANALGTISINNNGVVQLTGGASVLVGDGSSSTGVVSIASGVFSHTSTGGTLSIGSANVGTINQTGGALTNTAGDTLMSGGSHGMGTWNISGGVARVNFLHIGNGSGSPATLNISGSGLFISQQTIELGAGNGNSTNTINLNGGTLSANGIQADSNNKATSLQVINFNGGVLQARTANGNFLTAINPLQFNLLAGGLIFDDGGFAETITNALSGVGGVTKQGGAGTLTLSGVNTYSGLTVVQNGELVSPTTGSAANSAFVIMNGATNGVQVSGANGQWTCVGMTNGSGTTYADFNFGAVTPSTSIAPIMVNGNVAFNGTLNVIVRGSAITSAGTYPLIQYTGSLSGTPPSAVFSLPNSVLTANLVNNTGNKSIDLRVSAVTFGPISFLPSPMGATVGSNAVSTMTVPAAATAGGPLVVTLTSANPAVAASQTVTVLQGVTSTNVSFPILAAGVSTLTASGPGTTPATVQVTGSLPSIILPAGIGAIVGSNAVATMTITNQFPFSGSYTVTLTSDNPGVTASQTLTLNPGVVSTNLALPILGVGVANVTASGAGLNPLTMQVTGGLPSIVLPAAATGNVGANVTATMTLTCPFPFTGPYTVTLTSGNTAITPNQTVTLPAGVATTNLSFALLTSGLTTVTATGAGLNSASMMVGDTASVFAVGMANQWVADDYVTGNAWVDRVAGAEAALDGGGIPPVSVPGGFSSHAGVRRDPNGGDTGFSIPAANPPTGYTNYTVSVVLYSPTAGPSGGAYYQDQIIIGYDIGGSGQADWGMSWGSPNGSGRGVTVGIGQSNGDTALTTTNALALNTSHAIAMQTRDNNIFSLYVDGVRMAQVTNLSLRAPQPTASVIPLLSNVGANIGNVFTNMIAEARIYTNVPVDGAALTTYLQSLYVALPISLPASVSATVGSSAAATMTVPAAATASGAMVVTLTSDNPAVTASQTVTLPQGTTSTNLSLLILGVGVANVTASGTEVVSASMIVDGLPLGSALWSGSVNNVWDINATANWSVGGNASVYFDGSPVVFDDTGANPNVSLAAAVAPQFVVVSNSSVYYSFSGAGIDGTGGLLKQGSAGLTFSNANTYAGATVISNGAVQLAAPAAIPSGTVAYYTFDDPANLGADSSGLGNTLVTATGAPVYNASGVSGGALYLDGSSTLNVGGGFPAGVPTGASPYTIAVWERLDAGGSGNGGFVGWGDSSPDLCNNLRLNGANSVANYWFANDFTVSGLPVNPADGGWHAIVATWDGVTNSIYVDGVLGGSRTPGTPPDVSPDNFVVGKTTADVNFKGWLDKLMIVNRALPPAEVAAYQSVGALPAATGVQIHGGGSLALNGNNQTIGSLAGDAGTMVSLGSGTLTTGGNNTSSRFAGSIGGSGKVNVVGTNTFILAGANSYSGGTVAQSGILDVQHDGGLGSGNVSVASGASLILEAGVANTYIASTATLMLTDPATMNLAFTGMDTISNLVINGVQQMTGTWGSSSSAAANKDDVHFAGTGVLNVVSGAKPPPSSPTILPVRVDGTGTNLVLRVATVTGYNYILEATTNLAPPIVWSAVVTNAGNGGMVTNTAPIRSTQPKMFFRYLVQ